MRNAACTWSSVASGSDQNACAARCRWSEVMRFQRREGVSVVSVISWYSTDMKRIKWSGLAVLALAAVVAAQTAGVHPISGRRFAPVMGYQGADWLEPVERDDDERPGRARHGA